MMRDGDVARLGAAAVALEKAAERGGHVDGVYVGAIGRRLCRAFVWAVYRGEAPDLAIAASWYGVTTLEDLGPRGVADVTTKAKRLAGLGVALPTGGRP